MTLSELEDKAAAIVDHDRTLGAALTTVRAELADARASLRVIVDAQFDCSVERRRLVALTLWPHGIEVEDVAHAFGRRRELDALEAGLNRAAVSYSARGARLRGDMRNYEAERAVLAVDAADLSLQIEAARRAELIAEMSERAP